MGKSEDKCAGMKRMYYQEYGDIIVPAHPKEDVNALGEDEEKKVVKEEKNRNRQEDVEHDEESIKVDRSQSKSIFKLKYRRVNKGYFILKGKLWKHKRNKISGQCSGATRVPSGGNTASEEPKIQRSERG